jgi:rare lipoprotein A
MLFVFSAGDADRLSGHSSIRRTVQFAAIALALGACSQSPNVTSETRGPAASHHAALDRRHRGFVATHSLPTAAKTPSYGLASYYSEGTSTASGESFDPNALTAAHPNLPFGTKLRVTNLATGKSVVVRVNDRGPFVPGRIVDVSSSAAQQLGIVDRGTAAVKIDVVQ